MVYPSIYLAVLVFGLTLLITAPHEAEQILS
jgi:hypothetical protein